MEISTGEYNNPVNFYTKNMGNNINTAIESENHLYSSNVFLPEISQTKQQSIPVIKKKKKNKRLNTLDSDYFPEGAEEASAVSKTDDGNFFISSKQKNVKEKVKNLIKKIPLINYIFLKNKTKKIKKTIESLNDINQNVDELLSSAIPYGETGETYQNIAKNLTNAANIIIKSNKDL